MLMGVPSPAAAAAPPAAGLLHVLLLSLPAVGATSAAALMTTRILLNLRCGHTQLSSVLLGVVTLLGVVAVCHGAGLAGGMYKVVPVRLAVRSTGTVATGRLLDCVDPCYAWVMAGARAV